MGQLVVMGAMLKCSFGMTPSPLTTIPKGPPVTVTGMVAGTIMDFAPMANIMPFGMCITLSNPEVAAATAAAFGVLTPMPCIPVTVAPWTPGSPTVEINKFPALNNESVCMCTWGGVITVTEPGEVLVTVP